MPRRRHNPLYGNGGTTYDPHANYAHPSPKPHQPYDGYIAPPPYTYDPAIEAQRRAAHRGLEDKEQDVTTQRHFTRSNLRLALQKQHREAARGRQDIGLKQQEGERKLGRQEEDVKKSAGRQMADFKTRLADIARQFKEQGHRQGEAANAAGVYDQGTLGAAAAARGRNQQLAEAPIHTAEQRTQEDLATALKRAAEGRTELGEDSARATRRLNQDVRFNKKQAKRETGQKLFGLFRELQRARREGKITDVDLLAQEIYEARNNHPGAFKQWAKEHPGAAQAAAAGVPPAQAKPSRGGGGKTSKGGGTSAGGHKRRRH